ncbi:hypothetical protein vseg_007266 [Gypsophila vaccaria]
MTRRCSHCSNNGHNSRTCPTRATATTTACGGGGGGGGGVKLFGVRLTDGSFMKKSASMGNLSHYYSSTSAATSPVLDHQAGSSPVHDDPVRDGYLSDDPTHHVSCSSSSSRRGERKKGKPWTEEEHRLFLIGLSKLGKGDWRGIARSYVVSRTPTQVASHAQKYFIRQSNATRRKRRSSLFDMVPDMVTEEPEHVPDEQSVPPLPEPREIDDINALPSLDLSLGTESEPMEATSTEEVKETQDSHPLPSNLTLPMPAFFVPLPYPPIWQQTSNHPEDNTQIETSHHQVLKPIPVHLKEPVDVDHLMGMSQLNLSETENGLPAQPQVQLSLNILGAPSRQSAFHASAPASSSELKEGKSSVIPAA